jgi:DNA primase
MIDNATIERIQQTAQIAEVVSDFIALRKTGSGYKGLCPFHDDRNPSMSISPAKNIFKCFVCGEGGAPVHFVMKHEKIPYHEALKYLARKYNIEIRETELTDEQKQEHNDRESMHIINQFARDTFIRNLTNTDEGLTIALTYFHERGFRDDTIKKFQLGYSLNERDAFTLHALQAGYRQDLLEKTGLTIIGENNYRADRFRGRVIFPIHSISGKTVGFGGRIMSNTNTGKLAKYINSIDSEIYHKNAELYGIYFARQAIASQDKCYLVEGYTDVISMHQSGIENTVAPCGTALTNNQIRLIRRLTQNITLINDGDTAGNNATLKDIPLLLEAGINVRIVTMPEGEDPDSFSRKNNATTVANYIKNNETNFVTYKTKQLFAKTGSDPAQTAQNITEIVDTIALISDEITRLAYIKECSRITSFSEETLIRRTAQKRNENNIKKKKDLYPDAINTADNPPQPDTPTTPIEQHENQPQPPHITNPNLDRFERSIIHYIIRYGEADIANPPQDPPKPGKEQPFKPGKTRQPEPTVITTEFIINELAIDHLTFSNPLYRRILEETHAHLNDPGFTSENHFKYHPDPDISNLAAEILIDKYRESTIHARSGQVQDERRKLRELVPYAVINYKKAILDEQIKILNTQIAEAQAAGNTAQLKNLIEDLKHKNELKTKIAASLQRVINTNSYI